MPLSRPLPEALYRIAVPFIATVSVARFLDTGMMER